MRKNTSVLRVCANCEWMYKLENKSEIKDCPKCNFGSYSAHYVFGKKAYRLFVTQRPWMDKKLAIFSEKLYVEISKSKDGLCNSDHIKLTR